MNLTPRYYLDVTADGVATQWALGGTALVAVDAVQRNSGDAGYIESGTLNDRSTFVCGDGYYPQLGIIGGVTLHYRARVTDLTGGPNIDFIFTQGAGLYAIGAFVPTTTGWVEGSVRMQVSPGSGVRFVAAEMEGMGLGVEVNVAPVAGEFQVSELWLEVEHIVAPEFYDPIFGVLPDAAAPAMGDYMRWIRNGGEVPGFVGTYLQLADTDPADYVAFERTTLPYGPRYFSVVDTRFFFQTLPGAGTELLYLISSYEDAHRSVQLAAFIANGATYVGLIGAGLDYNDPNAYLVLEPFDFSGQESHHFRLWVEREEDEILSKVSVYADYGEAPLLQYTYANFPTSGTAALYFGTGVATHRSAQVDVRVDYVSWWTARRYGESFADWYDVEGPQNRVQIETADPYIVRPVQIPPTEIMAGQSQHCCRLESPTTQECAIKQYWNVRSGGALYDLSVYYRMDTLLVDGRAFVQRVSDHFYWDDVGKAWQSAYTDVAVPNSMLRTNATVMTDIQTATPDTLILWVGRASGAPVPHNIYVYKVDLRE